MQRVTAGLIALALTSACRCGSKQGSVVQLPSGNVVRVYSVGRLTFKDQSHPPSLMLRYETKLELGDSEALRSEVMEVWELLRPQCDASGDTYAMVMANEPIRGVVSRTRGFTYGFERTDGGGWRMREPKKREARKGEDPSSKQDASPVVGGSTRRPHPE